jgi:hypothetical protein
MMWLPAAGLDRHTALIGLLPLSAPRLPNRGPSERIQDAIYRPICELRVNCGP